MPDSITTDRIKLLHPLLRDGVSVVYDKICNHLTGRSVCRFSHTLRTIDEQQKLYDLGRTVPGQIVTKARPGYSYHNYGLAIDIVLIIEGKTASWDMVKDHDGDLLSDWMEVVNIFKESGWEWGGDFKSFKDYPHFQFSFGLKIQELRRRYQAGEFIPGSKYVKI